jgi:hypothetical protein
MLDYHGNRVALAEFTTSLAGAVLGDPAVADARDRDLAAVAGDEGAALLGAFVHHLIGHAASDGAEVDLVERAAGLWQRGSALCDRLGASRSELERALEDPSAPGADNRFNSAAVDVQVLGNEAIALRTQVDELRADVLGFAHLPAHPRQSDQKTDTWDWGNLTAGRRTDAFVRSLYRHVGDPRTNAFALGAAASYGGNIAGSAYIAQAVGGPRRAHRYRDRIARNSFGAYLAAHHPAAMSPSAMAAAITSVAGGAGLAPELETQLRDALSETFDLTRTLPIPDLQVGFDRLVRHLGALDGFTMPAAPTPPAQVWIAKLFADPQNPPPSLRPQDIDVVGQDDGGVAVQYGGSSPGSTTTDSSDSNKAAKGCGIAILLIILIDLVQAFVQCIGQWANGHTCTFWDNMLLSKVFEQDPPDPRDPTHPNTDEEALTAMADSPQIAQFVGMLFDAHGMAWEALSRGYNFLASTGLIYPHDLIATPMYAQFTSLPGFQSWPQREEAKPVDTYHRYPTSPIENPVESPSPFATSSAPPVFVASGPGSSAADVTMSLWRQIAEDVRDSQNRDLDADRGFGHACWAAGGSVHDDPIAALTLQYDEQ